MMILLVTLEKAQKKPKVACYTSVVRFFAITYNNKSRELSLQDDWDSVYKG